MYYGHGGPIYYNHGYTRPHTVCRLGSVSGRDSPIQVSLIHGSSNVRAAISHVAIVSITTRKTSKETVAHKVLPFLLIVEKS